MIPPTAYGVPGEQSSPRFARAWAQGCGGRIEHGDVLHPGPVALFGSPARWPLLNQAIAEGRDWYYADHGYFRRFEYYRVTRNAYQLDRMPISGEGGDDRRLRACGVEIRPWRRRGEHILVCPPDEAFAALHGFNAGAWMQHIREALRNLTERPVRVRERACADVTLADDLVGAWCLVTYVSNAAVEAVCTGIPVIATGRCSAAAMGTYDLTAVEDPPRPRGRRRWAAWLASNQWTMQEIVAGEAWRAIGLSEE